MKYTGEFLNNISFPVGGIGTGSIGLAGNGRLIDWEIFNKPAKNSINGYSHFAVRAIEGEKITARVLNGDLQKNFIGGGHGADNRQMIGFPHFKNVEFDGRFPIALLNFSDDSFPGEVKMKAFNPFIPLDSDNSSIPAAFFEIEIKNPKDSRIKYQIALSVSNPYEKSENKSSINKDNKLITMYNTAVSKASTEYGDLTVATDCKTAYAQEYWYRGMAKDDVVTFWNEFSSQRKIKERHYEISGNKDTCTLIAEIDVKPNESKTARFVLSWNVPNNHNYWDSEGSEFVRKPWKNYYATIFKDSANSAIYSLDNWSSLYQKTLAFTNALHNTTMPPEVIDAASANLSVLKSPTVWRLEDGSFYGWEGVNDDTGSCEGTCQHVWNYAYAMCFLFPDLERSIRELEFKHCTDENGRMAFRILLPLGRETADFRACVDGQMGAVLKCYREWKISGNNDWIKENWENIKKVLEYAWSPMNEDEWDIDKDGVIEGRQHHTLDRELFGPSSWLEGMYLAALKATAEIGEFLGDKEKACEYRTLFNKGYEWTKENLFNGRYFIHKIDLNDKSVIDRFAEKTQIFKNEFSPMKSVDDYWNFENNQIKYQIGQGSSIDQMLAQWHANILGLGAVFDKKQISTALDEMMNNNFKSSMRDFVNPWRIYSLNDEAGTVMCDYPKGVEKPEIPVMYCEETMTGFEYSFAGLLLSEGKYEEGLRVIRAVRNRFDGNKRNPWNEFECGHNYARSMASFAFIPILSGFEFDMPNKHIGFNPYIKDRFNSVWSLADAWGTFEAGENCLKLNILQGNLTLKTFGMKWCSSCSQVKIDGKEVDFEFKAGVLCFNETDVAEKVEIKL